MIENYKELTISKYRELVGIEKDGDNDMEYGILILSVLSGLDPDELMDMPLDKFSTLMAKTKFLYTKVDKLDFNKIGKKITINGKDYKLMRSAKDLTAGQYIDYTSYISKENFLEMLPYILTVFLVPDGKKYANGYDIGELAKEFDENVDIPTALGISDFFLHQSKVSIMSSIAYLKWKMKRMAKKEMRTEVKEQINNCLEQLESLKSLLNVSVGFIQQ